MDVVHERAVGIDISKRDAKVCVRIPGKRKGQFTSTVTTWGSTTNEILRLVEFLVSERVTVVVMEATSAREAILFPHGSELLRRFRTVGPLKMRDY